MSEARAGSINGKRHRRVHQQSNIVRFAARKFDADLLNTYGESSVKTFPYKDAKGQDSAMQLRPKDVVGAFVTPAPRPDPDEEMPITYKVAHSH